MGPLITTATSGLPSFVRLATFHGGAEASLRGLKVNKKLVLSAGVDARLGCDHQVVPAIGIEVADRDGLRAFHGQATQRHEGGTSDIHGLRAGWRRRKDAGRSKCDQGQDKIGPRAGKAGGKHAPLIR